MTEFFFLSFKSFHCLKFLSLKRYFTCDFFVKFWGFKDCHFEKINARYISLYERVGGDLIRLGNRSKLAIFGSLLEAKPITLNVICREGADSFKKKSIFFFTFTFVL